MKRLCETCSIAAVALLWLLHSAAFAYQLSLDPTNPKAGDAMTLTLSGDLNGISFLQISVAVAPDLLSATLPGDPLAVLDDGVAGKGEAFAFYDNVGTGTFDYVVVAGTDLSVSNGPIVNFLFTALSAGKSVVTVSTCAATALQNCIPGDADAPPISVDRLDVTVDQGPVTPVPEPSAFVLVLAMLLCGIGFLGQRRNKSRLVARSR